MDEKLGTRCGTFFVMVGFSSLMLRLHFIHIIITVCVCVYSVEAHDFYENTTAARIFGSFFAFCRLQCVPFAFISPYYFQYISVGFFLFSYRTCTHTHSQNTKTPAQCTSNDARATATAAATEEEEYNEKKMVLCIIYLLFARRCIFKGRKV